MAYKRHKLGSGCPTVGGIFDTPLLKCFEVLNDKWLRFLYNIQWFNNFIPAYLKWIQPISSQGLTYLVFLLRLRDVFSYPARALYECSLLTENKVNVSDILCCE